MSAILPKMNDATCSDETDLVLRTGRGGQGTSKANQAKLALLEANMLLFLIMPGAAKKDFLVLIYEFMCYLGFSWVTDASSDQESEDDEESEFDPVKSLMACIRGNALKQDAYQDGSFFRMVMHVTEKPRIKCRWFRRGETAQDWHELSEEDMEAENPWKQSNIDSTRSHFNKVVTDIVAVPEALFPILNHKLKKPSSFKASQVQAQPVLHNQDNTTQQSFVSSQTQQHAVSNMQATGVPVLPVVWHNHELISDDESHAEVGGPPPNKRMKVCDDFLDGSFHELDQFEVLSDDDTISEYLKGNVADF